MMNIFEAIENNNLARVKELLDSGIDVNSKDEYGYTLLYIACAWDFEAEAFEHFDIAEALQNNHIEIIRLLLAHPDIDVNSQDSRYGFTPLNQAIQNNHIEIVRLLLAHPNIDVNGKLLFECSNNIEILQLLLAHPNINVNIQNSSGNTLLHNISEMGHTNVNLVKLLLSHPDIDVNIQNNKRLTPLRIACQKGHSKFVELLLKRSEVKIDFDYILFNKVRNLIKNYKLKQNDSINKILDNIEV